MKGTWSLSAIVEGGFGPYSAIHVKMGGSMSRIYAPYTLYLALVVISVTILRAEFLFAVLFLVGGLAIKTWVGQQKVRGTALGFRSSTMGAEPAPKTGEPEE